MYLGEEQMSPAVGNNKAKAWFQLWLLSITPGSPVTKELKAEEPETYSMLLSLRYGTIAVVGLGAFFLLKK